MNLKAWMPKIKMKMTIANIWSAGVTVALILLLSALWADYVLYKNFVSEKEIMAAEDGGAALKKMNLERAGQKLREQKAFLDNPAFPFVQNLF